jgi:hypothetical protein
LKQVLYWGSTNIQSLVARLTWCRDFASLVYV